MEVPGDGAVGDNLAYCRNIYANATGGMRARKKIKVFTFSGTWLHKVSYRRKDPRYPCDPSGQEPSSNQLVSGTFTKTVEMKLPPECKRHGDPDEFQ